jgi:hypothetical protein
MMLYMLLVRRGSCHNWLGNRWGCCYRSHLRIGYRTNLDLEPCNPRWGVGVGVTKDNTLQD